VLEFVFVFVVVPSTSPCWTAFAMSGEAAVEAIPATIKSLLLILVVIA